LEAAAIQVILAGKPVKILAAYLSPSHPLIGPDRMFRRKLTGLDGRRSQRQTCGLELASDHETGETHT
jgi:hypothetical protein